MTEKHTPQTTPATTTPDASQRDAPHLDAHGHDPAAYDWVPVLRKRRKDGWTPEKQRAFIEALADCGVVIEAARSVGMSDSAAYTLRRAPGAEGFAAAWDAALAAASRRLIDIAFDRAINGVDDVILDKEGRHLYTKRKYNDRLLMFLIRAHAPDRYRHGNRDGRGAGEGQQTVPAQPPVAEALKLLGPEPPAQPEKLLSPEALEDALEIADIMDGRLPHWQRQERTGDEEEPYVDPKLARLTVSKLQISDIDSEKGDSD
ncbi:hypothetical protein [Sphingorhabdus sp. SMR4y]|uniref:hypothetical protein n=1 Tax=Sphingorhabdus sp. SMR4y TaxID=2584094 RepID=UPI000B5C5A8E|nr:hypothetical protein [Sphingorhabdus sp. SMR4y]ASK87289.1 hypothetical protein SPHFLASMR4Y_00503 [Sphingorhabdus sp. SMR4y]